MKRGKRTQRERCLGPFPVTGWGDIGKKQLYIRDECDVSSASIHLSFHLCEWNLKTPFTHQLPHPILEIQIGVVLAPIYP